MTNNQSHTVAGAVAPKKRWPAKQKAHHPGKMAGFKMNSQKQSAKANSKTKPMIAPVLACQNGGKPNGSVRKNTCYQAFAAHDETVGFVAPRFFDRSRNSCLGMVCGRGGGHPQGRPHGLVHVLNHHAHPQRVRTLRVVPSVHQGTKTMQMATTQRTSAPTTHHGHTLPTYRDTHHTGNHFNRDVIAVGNAENAIARVLFELRKPCPDNARALKLAQSAMLAIGLVGEVLQ